MSSSLPIKIRTFVGDVRRKHDGCPLVVLTPFTGGRIELEVSQEIADRFEIGDEFTVTIAKTLTFDELSARVAGFNQRRQAAESHPLEAA